MPTCIYCKKTKQSEKFSNEHVLTRAFCGAGVNWTIVDAVCSECNGLFSTFESHWAHSAVEGMMRNFSGSLGRSSKSKKRRLQPIESNHVYIVQRDDPLVYEAGFAFPNDFYFRPQIVQCIDGLVSLSADRKDISVLQSAINQLIRSSEIELSSPQYRNNRRAFNIAKLIVDLSKMTCSFVSEREAKNSSGYWLRSYPSPPIVKGFDGVESNLTPRCALDDRKRLYFRAGQWSEVVELLNNLLQNKRSLNRNLVSAKNHLEQTIRIGFSVKLPLIYRAVLKTGFNLFANLVGTSLTREIVFDDLRRILLDKNADSDVMKRCRLLDDSSQGSERAEFPSPNTDKQHRLMLDIYRGNLCFRIRLYGYLGYEAILAKATPTIIKQSKFEGVVVNFDSTGMRRVSAWP